MHRFGLVFTLLTFACAGDDDSAERAPNPPCEQLREHVISLRLATVHGNDREVHRGPMRDALGADFIRYCEEHYSSSELQCALAAADTAAAMACAVH